MNTLMLTISELCILNKHRVLIILRISCTLHLDGKLNWTNHLSVKRIKAGSHFNPARVLSTCCFFCYFSRKSSRYRLAAGTRWQWKCSETGFRTKRLLPRVKPACLFKDRPAAHHIVPSANWSSDLHGLSSHTLKGTFPFWSQLSSARDCCIISRFTAIYFMTWA